MEDVVVVAHVLATLHDTTRPTDILYLLHPAPFGRTAAINTQTGQCLDVTHLLPTLAAIATHCVLDTGSMYAPLIDILRKLASHLGAPIASSVVIPLLSIHPCVTVDRGLVHGLRLK